MIGAALSFLSGIVLWLWSPPARDFLCLETTKSMSNGGFPMRVWVGSNWYSSRRGYEYEDLYGSFSLLPYGQRTSWVSEGVDRHVDETPRSGMAWGRFGSNRAYWREVVGGRRSKLASAPNESSFGFEFAQWQEFGVGWPFIGLSYEVQVDEVELPSRWIGVTSLPDWRVLPARWRRSVFPIGIDVRGSALNTVFYGGFCVVLLAAGRFGRACWRTRRMQRGRCPRCSYDLRRDFSCGCPECGWGRGFSAREA